MEYRISPGKLIDITRPLNDSTPAWPGDVRFRKDTSVTHGFRTSKLIMSSHCGTHIDAPAHLAGCRTSVDDIPMNRLILPAVIADCTGKRIIEKHLIDDLSLNGKALLLKTSSGSPAESSNPMEYSYLSSNAAELAVEKGAKMIGIDTFSVDPPDSADAHEILLGASIPILENLLLDDVLPGNYLLMCFPLKITDGDGSPVRVFLQRY
ncbi:MAG: hypothetical protein GQ565_09150 [Candidatus Aegiribacteria sp.]|nr:hypothetical protein [Candidatus Aegiribacteria sp.]